MKNKIMRFCFSVLVTLLFLTLLCWTTHSNLFVKNTLCLWILGGIYLTSILYMFTLDYCIVISKEIGVLKTFLQKIATLLVCIVFIVIFPIKYGDVLTQNYCEKMMLTNNEITISPLHDINEKSTSAEIWIEKILIDYKNTIIDLPAGWTYLDGYIYAEDANVAEPLTINVPKGSSYQIEFVKTQASGMIEYRVGERTLIVDLYSEGRQSFELEPEEIWGVITSAPVSQRMVYYASYLMVLWIIVDTIWVYFFNRFIKKTQSEEL